MNEPKPTSASPAATVDALVDVLVIGGGPGGSTAATMLARAGHSVLLLEREKFPRFHIGESLLPHNLSLFERLGVAEKVRALAPTVKHGAQFYHEGTELERIVLFERALTRRQPYAYQVRRAEFDHMLLEHARESGAVALEEARVDEVLFEGERAVGARYRLAGESAAREVRSKVVVDASGRDALLARKRGWHEKDEAVHRSAAFAHYSGVARESGPRGGDLIVFSNPEGWTWIIPFSDGTSSVGIVLPSHRFAARGGRSLEAFFDDTLAASPQTMARLAGGTRITRVWGAADYSYKSRVFCGDGFVLVGDSAAFLDPVFSSGVYLAMASAEHAADAIDRGLRRRGRVEARDFRSFERRYRRAIAMISKYVYGFYEPAFRQIFYANAPLDRMRAGITSILAGHFFPPSPEVRFWHWLTQIGRKASARDLERAGREVQDGLAVPDLPAASESPAALELSSTELS